MVAMISWAMSGSGLQLHLPPILTSKAIPTLDTQPLTLMGTIECSKGEVGQRDLGRYETAFGTGITLTCAKFWLDFGVHPVNAFKPHVTEQ
jgi:hypothetical protein